jgi:quercetin dioxygenase-like cupin family protein
MSSSDFRSEQVALGPNRATFLIAGEETGGKFSLTEFAAAPPPAPSAPAHRHLDADETLYILEGEFQFILEDRTIHAPPGSFIHIPKGTPHAVANVGTTTGRMLVILTPAGFEGFWAERAQLPTTSGSQIDSGALLALQEKYHMDTGGTVRQFSTV